MPVQEIPGEVGMSTVTRLRPRFGPILDVYADAAMDRECPACGAAARDWCRRRDGEYRRTPCIARLKYAVPEVDS
jgi:hypothetical protein